MRSAFNTYTLALMPIAIVINIVIGRLMDLLHLPLYLDQIGTILVGVLAGPIAVVSRACSQASFGVSYSTSMHSGSRPWQWLWVC